MGPRVPWDKATLELARTRLHEILTPLDSMVFTAYVSDWHLVIGSMENRIREAFDSYQAALTLQRTLDESDRGIYMGLVIALVQITLSSFGGGPLVSVISGVLKNTGATQYIVTAIPGLLQWSIQLAPNTLLNLFGERAKCKVNSWLAPFVVPGKSMADLGTGLRGAVQAYIYEALTSVRGVYQPYTAEYGAERALWEVHWKASKAKGRAVTGAELRTALLAFVRDERKLVQEALESLKCPVGPRHITQGEALSRAYERTLWAMHILSMPKADLEQGTLGHKLGKEVEKRFVTLGIAVRRTSTIWPLGDTLTGGQYSAGIRAKDSSIRASAKDLEPGGVVIGKHRTGHQAQAALIQWAREYLAQGPLYTCLGTHRVIDLYQNPDPVRDRIMAEATKKK